MLSRRCQRANILEDLQKEHEVRRRMQCQFPRPIKLIERVFFLPLLTHNGRSKRPRNLAALYRERRRLSSLSNISRARPLGETRANRPSESRIQPLLASSSRPNNSRDCQASSAAASQGRRANFPRCSRKLPANSLGCLGVSRTRRVVAIATTWLTTATWRTTAIWRKTSCSCLSRHSRSKVSTSIEAFEYLNSSKRVKFYPVPVLDVFPWNDYSSSRRRFLEELSRRVRHIFLLRGNKRRWFEKVNRWHFLRRHLLNPNSYQDLGHRSEKWAGLELTKSSGK